MGADDEDVLRLEVAVVDEPGHPVEADGRLAGTGTALDDEDVRGGAGDQLHLVAADGLDDVPHPPAARSLELLQQEVVRPGRPPARPALDVTRAGDRERLLRCPGPVAGRPGLGYDGAHGHGSGSWRGFGRRRGDLVEVALDDLSGAPQPPPQGHFARLLGPGLDPRLRERAGPQQDHRFVLAVPHPSAPDVPRPGLRARDLRSIDAGEDQRLVAEPCVRLGVGLRLGPVGDRVLAAGRSAGCRTAPQLGEFGRVAVVRVSHRQLLAGEDLVPSGGAHVRPPCGVVRTPPRACARAR